MLKKIISILPFLLLFAFSAHAAPDKYRFDKDHTHIIFFVNHEGFSDMIGRIKDFDGYFTFDEKEPSKGEVDVTMNAASVDTDVPELNKVLSGEKFFNVARFPAIHFKSTGVTLKPPAAIRTLPPYTMWNAELTGNLTLLGVTKPVMLHVRYNKSGIHPFTNNYVSGFSADGVIMRSDFGMKAYIPDVGDIVHIHIEVEGIDPLKHPGNSKAPH